jgi:O-antigen ligase
MALPSVVSPREHLARAPRTPRVHVVDVLVAYGPTLIMLTLPLEFTAMYLGQPLVRWIMVLVGAALGYLVVTGRRQLILPRQPSVLWLAAFIGVSVVSWLLTRAPSSYKAFADVALYPIFAVMVYNLMTSRNDHRRAWIAFLVSGLGVALLGLVLDVAHLHIWTPNPIVASRLNITFGDPNITARFLTLVAAAAIVLFATRRAPRWLCTSSGVACAAVLPMTWSRSGLAVFIVTAVLAAVVVTPRRRGIALAVAMLAVFVLSTAVSPVTRLRAIDAYNTFVSFADLTGLKAPVPKAPAQTNDTVLTDNRRYLVEAGVRMFRDHPVLGVGYGGFQNQLSTTYEKMIPPNLANRDVASHTGFVTIAAEMGVVGLGLFLLFLVQLAREALRAWHNVWVVLPATLVVPIVLYAQFEGRLIEEPYLWVCLALLYAAHRPWPRPRMPSHTM